MRRYAWIAIATSALAIFPAMAATAGQADAGASIATPDRTRIPQLSPAFVGGLDGVAALSASNAWAVGSDANNSLILHWNGRRWQKVAAANPSPGSDDLDGIAALSAHDAWAVGARGGDALVLHWDGRAWKSVPNPRLKGGSLLTGVAITSARGAWAVGGTGNPSRPLIEHWNGRAWRAVRNPYTRPADLWAVTASSAANVWAVGEYFFGTNGTGVLVEHWNGKVWRRVLAPNPLDSEFIGAAVTSATNAWAVGDYTNNTITDHTLVEHWNGKRWSRVASPSPRQGAVLFGVAAKSRSLAFAVGTTETFSFNLGNTFLEEWNGHVWREVTKPTPFAGQLAAVAFGSANSAFAAGSNDSLSYNPNGWTLTEHWNGATWR